MIVYGIKRIHLETTNVPLACSNCGHDQRHIHIYRNFFTLFFIPVLPLFKKFFTNCPHCKNEQTKKEFLKEFSDERDLSSIKEYLKSTIKEARTPLYTYITTVLAFTLILGSISWIYYADQQSSLMVASYAQEPKDNVLAIIRDDEEVYPYMIMYISHIRDQEAIIFEWKYSYKSLRDAQKDIHFVKNSISENEIKKKFLEPIIVSLDAFAEANFVYVHPLTIAAVDLEQFN